MSINNIDYIPMMQTCVKWMGLCVCFRWELHLSHHWQVHHSTVLACQLGTCSKHEVRSFNLTLHFESCVASNNMCALWLCLCHADVVDKLLSYNLKVSGLACTDISLQTCTKRYINPQELDQHLVLHLSCKYPPECTTNSFYVWLSAKVYWLLKHRQ